MSLEAHLIHSELLKTPEQKQLEESTEKLCAWYRYSLEPDKKEDEQRRLWDIASRSPNPALRNLIFELREAFNLSENVKEVNSEIFFTGFSGIEDDYAEVFLSSILRSRMVHLGEVDKEMNMSREADSIYSQIGYSENRKFLNKGITLEKCVQKVLQGKLQFENPRTKLRTKLKEGK